MLNPNLTTRRRLVTLAGLSLIAALTAASNGSANRFPASAGSQFVDRSAVARTSPTGSIAVLVGAPLQWMPTYQAAQRQLSASSASGSGLGVVHGQQPLE